METMAKPPILQYGTKELKLERGLGNVLLIVVCALLAISILGIPIAVLLMVLEHDAAKRLFCSECGTRLAHSKVKLCPCCKVLFRDGKNKLRS